MRVVPQTRPGLVDRSRVRVKALAVILNAERSALIVGRYRNQAGQHWHRPVGGNVELGELAIDAAVREVAEELGATLADPVPLGVLENIFELDGELGHEIDFLFVGTLAESDVVLVQGRPFDDGGDTGWVEWRPVQDPDPTVLLYPEGLQELIEASLRP